MSDEPGLAGLSPQARKVWSRLEAVLPSGMYLGDGTAASIRLHHRHSQDFDFFFHGDGVDLTQLAEVLERELGAGVSLAGPETLRVQISGMKVEFFRADAAGHVELLADPEVVGGIPVASPEDLMAMKLKVLAERGELRDYYDVMVMDTTGTISLEAGVGHWMRKYGIDRNNTAYARLIRALGYLDDCDEDEQVPMSKRELADWWAERQRGFLRGRG